VSQLVVCWIFWNLAPKQQNQPTLEAPTPEEEKSTLQLRSYSEPEVIYQDLDENSDLQARLWN
jgi:hypothetical protein